MNFFVDNMFEYVLSIAIITTIYVLLTQSYNLSFGLTGLFNLGHIIFYGVGAYTAAILNTKFGFSFFENLFFSGLVSGIFAGFFGLLTLRLTGHYLAIATLGLAMIAGVVATNWISLTNGPFGIRGIDEPILGSFTFDSPMTFFLLVLFITIIGNWMLYKIFHSPFGRIQRAIQDDEIAVQSVGKNIFAMKCWSLVLSAVFAGIAGAMYTHYRLFLDPSIFALPEIIFLILVVIVGGRGNFWGCILATILLFIIGEVPRFFSFPDDVIGSMRNLLYAALLIGVMFFRPEGVFTFFQKPCSK